MKKILLAVTAALAITSCSQNEEFEAPSQKAEINFNTAVTRATELNTNGLQKAGFEIYAYNTGTSGMTADVVLPAEAWISNSAKYTEGTGWSVDGGPYYWPLTDKLQFFAYSPKDGAAYTAPNASDKGYPKFVYTVGTTAANQKDLVIASVQDATKNQNGATSPVSFAFKHALTQVNIEVTKVDGYTYDISKVEVAGIKGSGTFTYAGVNAGTWTAGTDPDATYTYTLGDFTGNTTTIISDNALMLIPQELTNAKISISYTVKKGNSEIAENNKEVALSGTTTIWDFGKKIRYKLTLPIGGEKVGISADVDPWDSEATETPTVSE